MVKLSEIADITKLAGFEFTKYMTYVEDGDMIAIRALNLKNGVLVLDDVRKIYSSVSEMLPRSQLHMYDIVISYTGTIGECAQIREEGKFHLAPNVAKITPDVEKVDPDYLFQYIRSSSFKKQMLNYCGGSTQPTIPMKTIRELQIPLWGKEKEKKIASLLMDIDAKIANNNQINRNLSEQAETLFKSWFEDYGPWNGEMPNDWKQGVLGDFVTIKRGGSPRPIQEFLADEGLRWLKISDVSGLQSPYVLDIAEHIIEAGLKKTVHLEEGALVLSNSATPGIPKILDVDSCIHDGWLYFPESQLSNYFLYLFYKSIRPKLVALGNGSVFTNLKTDILKGYSFSKPDDDTLNRFDELVTPMFKTMREVARENKQLSEIRDSLLPKLMSGGLDVSNLNI